MFLAQILVSSFQMVTQLFYGCGPIILDFLVFSSVDRRVEILENRARRSIHYFPTFHWLKLVTGLCPHYRKARKYKGKGRNESLPGVHRTT